MLTYAGHPSGAGGRKYKRLRAPPPPDVLERRHEYRAQGCSARGARSVMRAACGSPDRYARIRQQTSAYLSAYVSIRQHTYQREGLGLSCAQPVVLLIGMRQHTSAYVSIRQHTSAYVSIRQARGARSVMRAACGSPDRYAHVCSRMLTYAHLCSRMLTQPVVLLIGMLTDAHGCSRMLTYAHAACGSADRGRRWDGKA
jgi:hypothetical protein